MGDNIQANFNDFEVDTSKDEICEVLLSIGMLFHNRVHEKYYLYGTFPIGKQCKGEVVNGELRWISVLTIEEILAVLMSEINNLKHQEPHKFPPNEEYDIKVYSKDIVTKSFTDKRGYPKSAGTTNANKPYILIIRGE
jgi:uncharacterized small protein (DUF1192 family)